MANLNETDEWFDGIYQLEEDDPVLGGPAGIDNLAPRQLASRGRYQRTRNVSPWRADFIYPAGESYVSFGGQTWKSVATSVGTQPGTDATKWMRWGYTEAELASALGDAVTVHEAKADPHPVYWNDPRGNAKIAAAIAALVNSSPAALDTLAELAAALGNDANFAATVTAALATKAPLNSPALTGVPTAPTLVAYTASAGIATANFVKKNGLRFSDFGSIPGGTYGLAITDLAKIIAVPANGQTVTLPPVDDTHIGVVQRLYVYPGTATYITVQAPAGQQISAGGTLANSLQVVGGGHTDFVWEGTGTQHWNAGGGGLLYKSPDFAAVYNTNGSQVLPGGLRFKWGYYNLGNLAAGATYAGSVAFVEAFPTTCYAALLSSSDMLMRTGVTGYGGGSISGNFRNDYSGTQPIAGTYFAIGK